MFTKILLDGLVLGFFTHMHENQKIIMVLFSQVHYFNPKLDPINLGPKIYS